jgi:hypothetical protein
MPYQAKLRTLLACVVVIVLFVAAGFSNLFLSSSSATSQANNSVAFPTNQMPSITLSSPHPHNSGFFGWSVATSGNIVVVGAPFEPDGHVYMYNASTDKLIRELASPNPQFAGNFGYSVALSGNLIAIGAIGENVNGFHNEGQAYIFYASTGKLIKILNSPNDQLDGSFGISIATSGNSVIVGSGTDHAYIFKGLLTIEEIITLTSPNESVPGNFGFGNSVAIKNNVILVGAFGEKTSEVAQAGHAYIFFG